MYIYIHFDLVLKKMAHLLAKTRHTFNIFNLKIIFEYQITSLAKHSQGVSRSHLQYV